MTSDDMEKSILLKEELSTYIAQGGMPSQAGPQGSIRFESEVGRGRRGKSRPEILLGCVEDKQSRAE